MGFVDLLSQTGLTRKYANSLSAMTTANVFLQSSRVGSPLAPTLSGMSLPFSPLPETLPPDENNLVRVYEAA